MTDSQGLRRQDRGRMAGETIAGSTPATNAGGTAGRRTAERPTGGGREATRARNMRGWRTWRWEDRVYVRFAIRVVWSQNGMYSQLN